MSDYQTPPGLQPPHREERGGAGGKIAAGCGIGCLAIFLVAGFLTWMGVRAIQAKVDRFVELAPSDPIRFEYPRVQANEVEAVVERFNRFREALADRQPVAPLVLSDDDINILINHHPNFAMLAGRTMVTIENNQIQSAVSIKAEDLPFKIPFLSKALRGKYLNGKATVDLKVKDGKGELYLVDFEFGDFDVPPEIMEGFQEENLLENSDSDPETKQLIEQLEELEVQDDKLRIVPKAEVGSQKSEV